jgi:hypothetical protein
LSPIILEKETCIKPREGVQKRLGGNQILKFGLVWGFGVLKWK